MFFSENGEKHLRLSVLKCPGDSILCNKRAPTLHVILESEGLRIGQALISWSVSPRSQIGTSPPPFG